jgi:hypothetical protein
LPSDALLTACLIQMNIMIMHGARNRIGSNPAATAQCQLNASAATTIAPASKKSVRRWPRLFRAAFRNVPAAHGRPVKAKSFELMMNDSSV